MKIQWTEVMSVANNAADEGGRLCPECNNRIPHETLHVFAISDGRRLKVKRVQTSSDIVLVWLDV